MIADALLDRFRPVLSPTAFALFEPLVLGAEIGEDGADVVLTFSTDATHATDDGPPRLRIRAATDEVEPVPDSLRGLLEVCAGMEMGEVGEVGQLVLHDGSAGTLATVGADAWSRKSSIPYSTELCAPIDLDLQAFYVIYPTGRLCFHDGMVEVVRDTSDPVEVYLREVHLRLSHAGVLARARPRHDWLVDPSA